MWCGALGGAIERWEDEAFRKCFADILNGNWKNHNPYDLSSRMKARHSIYGRSGQVSFSPAYHIQLFSYSLFLKDPL